MKTWSLSNLEDHFNGNGNRSRLLFIHPHYHNQHRIVHAILQRPNTAYVRFEGESLDFDGLQAQISKGIEDNPDILVLDECDRANPAGFQQMINNMLESTSDLQLVIVSRQVAYHILLTEEIRVKSRFIPTNEKLMLHDYAQRDDERILLEVRAFGSGRVQINGRSIDTWDGVLPRLLFFYLVDRGMVTRNDIFETFWRDLPVREATNVFHVTKRKVSEILDIPLTKYWSGFYRVAPEIELSYDVVRFTDLIQQSVVSEPEKATELLEYAIELYRGPFLNGINEDTPDWIVNRRAELREMYGEALSILARLKQDAGDEDRALGLYLMASKVLRHREEIVDQVMQIYRHRGKFQDALDVFSWLEDNLKDDLELDPSPTLRDLARDIKADLKTSVAS